jgi:hypothetical protein
VVAPRRRHSARKTYRGASESQAAPPRSARPAWTRAMPRTGPPPKGKTSFRLHRYGTH